MRALPGLLLAFSACGPAPLPPENPRQPSATASVVSLQVSSLKQGEEDAGPARNPAGDPEIVAMVASVDAARLRADVGSLIAFGTRHSLSDVKSDQRGIGAARRWLRRRFAEIVPASHGRLRVEAEDFTAPAGKRIPKPWPMQNVLAILPGTATGPAARTLVVSGHYDSRASDVMDATRDAPGANDDASGVAVVLEACRALAPYRFEATLVFAAVSGEEQGLYGSTALADKLRADGVRVLGMITNDIVGESVAASGRSDKQHVRVFSAGLPADDKQRDALLAVGGESDGPDRELARAIDEAARTYVSGFSPLLVFRADRYLRGGDQLPFHAAGAPAVRFTEVDENFRHQHQDVRGDAGDLPQFVDAAYMRDVARVDVAALASLARAPLPPSAVRLDVRDLAEDTTLLFVPGPDASASYQVVARPTDAPTWTRTFPAGRSGSVSVPLSKDHWLFGVRAVDDAGHASPALFPTPLRAGEPWPPAAPDRQ